MPAPEPVPVKARAPSQPRSVIVTRPAPDARRWVEQLQQRGLTAEALPLIEIVSVADLRPARAAWARLGEYAALMFVSGNAVEHFFAARLIADQAHGVSSGDSVPFLSPSQRVMAPGPGTARVLVAHGVPQTQLDTPGADASQFDSEALWQLVGQRDWAGRRVLVVRGQSEPSSEAAAPGREWLAQQLEQAGAQVDFVSVYERRAPDFSLVQRQRIAASQHDGSIWLFSSSQALGHLPGLAQADWSEARALATHPRIASAVRAAGWGVVIESRPSLSEIVRSIESLHS